MKTNAHTLTRLKRITVRIGLLECILHAKQQLKKGRRKKLALILKSRFHLEMFLTPVDHERKIQIVANNVSAYCKKRAFKSGLVLKVGQILFQEEIAGT